MRIGERCGCTRKLLIPALLSHPIFARAEADRAVEGTGENERALVADLWRDDLQFIVSGFQKVPGVLHSHVGDVMHGSPVEFTQAAR